MNRRNWKMSNAISYKFNERENKDYVTITLAEGQFEGVEFHYGKVKVIEENDEAKLDFTFHIDTNPYDNIDFDNSEAFHQTIGDILIDIIEKQIKDADDN